MKAHEAGLGPREQALVGAISRERIARDLAWFSANGLRLAGTEGERAGARYVRDRLVEDGLACELEAFDGWVSYGDEPERFGPATVTLRDGSRIAGKIYAFGGTTPPGGVSGELVWVGNGAPGDYAALGVDVSRKVALSTLSMDAPHGEPVRLAGERGAVGIVILNWSDELGRVVHTGTARGIWGNPTPEDLERERRIPVVSVSHEDGQRLRALTGTDVRLEVRTHARWARSEQPVAEIRGTGDEFVLVYCHLDTYGAGMTDNTTGVVGLMELARLLHARRPELARGVRLAWWAGHEMPYNGSTHHLDLHWDELRDRCACVLNADSWAIEGTVDRVLTWGFAETETLAVGCADEVLQRSTGFEDFDAREAEQSFWALGVPSIMTFSIREGYPDGLSYLGAYWHSEADTIDHVDQAALAQLVAIYGIACLRLCEDGPPPLRYLPLARRLSALLTELAAEHPDAIAWEHVHAAADRFVVTAADADGALDDGRSSSDASERLRRCAQAINPVVYTVGGRYAQDPSSASHLRKRLPGFQRALDGLAAADSIHAPAWRVAALRERNRTVDALREATRELEALCGA